MEEVIKCAKQQQIKELRKKIYSNIKDNTCYKMEIKDLENEIEDEHTLIEHSSDSD